MLMSWWWCLTHNDVEPDAGCGHKDRLGPYQSQESARDALAAAGRRTAEWDEDEENWKK